jgi:hypothetical protein
MEGLVKETLKPLLDTLSDANIPKVSAPDPAAAVHWLPEGKEASILRTVGEEILDSNWLRLMSLPPTLDSARILGSDRKIKVPEENRRIPWFEHEEI